MDLKTLMDKLGYKDVLQNKNNQFGKTYSKTLIDESKFSIRGHNKKTYLVTLELKSEDDLTKFNPSDFRSKIEQEGQACEFVSNDDGEDNKKNVTFKITVYDFIKR